jgi:glucosamine--fructose-6-phosphate aminotransferase (isomerizing)
VFSDLNWTTFDGHRWNALLSSGRMSKMLEEIREQPEALERTLLSELAGAEDLRKRLLHKRPKLIVLAARGTSDNAALFGKYLLEITTGIPVSLAAPSIFTLYKSSIELADVLVIAISQSGESTDTNKVLELARAGGAVTLGITNEASSSMTRLAEHVFLVRAGREKSVAATKTYTGQLLMFYLVAYALGAAIPPDDLKMIPSYVDVALKLEAEILQRTERYTMMEHAVIIGRGLNYSNAFEFALKLMETCYVVAERFSSADLMHGPIAMVGNAFPAFLMAPSGVTWPGLQEMLVKLQQLNAECLVITDRSNREAVDASRRSICIPMDLAHTGVLPAEVYTPIPYIVPAQLFAAYLAEQKGLNPDEPRTLSKVTLTM